MVSNVNLRLARNLKSLRKKSNKKQLEMAFLFNISQQNYSKLENGKTHFKNRIVSKICEIFQITPDEFYQGDNYIKPNIVSRDTDIIVLKNHYERLLLESELQIVRLEQKIRNYIPLQESDENDVLPIYVMI